MRGVFILLAMLAVTVPVLAESPGDLSRTEWGPENGLGQFVIFTADGQVKIWGGCNWYRGEYDQFQERLRLSELDSPDRDCEDMRGAEGAFIGGLERTRTVRLKDQDLELLNGEGRVILRLRQRDVWGLSLTPDTP